MREPFGPMLERGATTLWESFAPTASLCRGFSASPTYQLSRRVLGIAPAEPGFAAIDPMPDLAGLDHAEGVVPTHNGHVGVRLTREGVEPIAQFDAPDGVRFEVRPPAGQVQASPPTRTGTRIEASFSPGWWHVSATVNRYLHF